ncbi:hypothetical protein [Hansschlegelia zhihuaiae]|uniref:ParB/Sulfiredoxin domain-containing protein n=1 Tax=Hansschlegelia zhihuaiae TaxID=405005 RepID=A0A4V1KJQ8_9HYPH|nr:hypothetical protein [Hansschlegelia zhihuaiae]RXF75042.1 hypothetical protein EK403_03055 [Hansschlegelia zhihuaiae]
MTAAATIRAIEIARIDDTNRLRPVNPGAVAALMEAYQGGGDWGAIRVVERGDTFKLVFGAQRVDAARRLGLTEIVAEICTVEQYPDDTAIRLDEIQENFVRYELTKLDRAVNLAAWKAIYEAEIPVAGHGGRRRGAGRKIKSQNSASLRKGGEQPAFAERFSAAAAAFLDISERSVQLAVQIAEGVCPEARLRIAFTDAAKNQAELLLLAKEPPARQLAICDLLLSEPPAAHGVGEAIAILDGLQIVKLAGWERLSGAFARLKPAEQQAFYAAHEDEIRAWLAIRDAVAARRRKAA